MKKFFSVVAGQKLFCDADGILLKDDDDHYLRVKDAEDVDEDDLEEVEVDDDEEATEEVENMLSEAARQVKRQSKKDLEESQTKATEAVTELMDSIAKGAEKRTKIANKGDEPNVSFDVEGVKKQIEQFNNGRAKTVAFEMRDADEAKALLPSEQREKSTSTGDLTNDVIQPQVEPEVTRDPVRNIFIESIADVTRDMQSDHLAYVEATNESGAPAPTSELNDAPEKDFEFQEFKAYLKKVMVKNKHSVEILQDASQLVSAIREWLNEDILIKTDQDLINGDGNDPNLQGVFTAASDYNTSAIGTAEVDDPNLFDVVRKMITKIASEGKGKFSATHVLANPIDSDEFDLTKDADGRYLLPPFISEGGSIIKGARLVENVGIPEGKILVGDFRRFHIGTKGGVQIEMTDSDGEDFGKDILTVKLRRRVASYLRNNDSAAFWVADIADAKSDLTPAS